MLYKKCVLKNSTSSQKIAFFNKVAGYPEVCNFFLKKYSGCNFILKKTCAVPWFFIFDLFLDITFWF